MALPIELEIGRTNSRFFWSLQNKFKNVLKPLDITIEQLRMLMLIEYNEGCDQQFLANETLKVKSAITTILVKMVNSKLIIRVPDQHDGRNKQVFLTKKGKDLSSQGRKLITKETELLLKGYDPEEINRVIQIMQELTKKML